MEANDSRRLDADADDEVFLSLDGDKWNEVFAAAEDKVDSLTIMNLIPS